MSVLSFPRIYFKGFMEWDPCTFNNNDWSMFPTYNPSAAALNWSYLYQLTPPITQANLRTAFRPWAISLQDDQGDSPPGSRVPAEWNMFGKHGVSFVHYKEFKTTITGGRLGHDKPVTSDPIIGGPVVIRGDVGGHGQNPGRLVDTNPASPWSSQIYFGQLVFGHDDAAFSGPRAYRMHSRWLNPFRIYNPGQVLTAPASAIGVCFQTCIPFAEVKWPAAGASPLVDELRKAAGRKGARGIMMRFTGYVNLYFVNGFLNSIQERPRDYTALAALLADAWDAWNKSGDTSKFFQNPCYSHVVGAVGVWNDGELASVPGGRRLGFANPISPESTSDVVRLQPRIKGHELKGPAQVAGSATPVLLGPAAVNVDYDAKLISLDFGSAIPELATVGAWPSDLTKADFGQLSLGVMTNGQFTLIKKIDYSQYDRSAYEASAGIIDIPFPDADTDALLKKGQIAIQSPSNPPQTALLEQTYTAETDTRGIYLDQGGRAEFQVLVCKTGAPSPNTNLLLAQYDSNLNLVASNQTQFVEFLNGNVHTINAGGVVTFVTTLKTGADGTATFSIGARNAGFPVVAFFPFEDGDPLPQPAPAFSFIDNASYTTVRVLPFDDLVPQSFVDLWNAGQNQDAAWDFIYDQILYVYDMLFSVMLKFVNLGSRQAVEQSIASIWFAISEEQVAESTYAMPITRDMSAGKRKALQLWIYLVANQYNVPNFSVNSIPAGWTPPG